MKNSLIQIKELELTDFSEGDLVLCVFVVTLTADERSFEKKS